MKKILVIGAGRSASTLIKYLIDNSNINNWNIIIADSNIELARKKISNSQNAKAVFFDAFDVNKRQKLIKDSDVVVSMLPSNLHIIIAKDCLQYSKNLITASYVSKELQLLNSEVKKKNLIFLNEIGLDPGIDHMSAQKEIDSIKSKGGHIKSFKSFCGGLIAPKYDNNPWGYKFTWNPRNVVLAGQGTAQYLYESNYKYISYNKLYSNLEKVEVLDAGDFEAYANRDSLSYRKIYNINDVPSILRGTLRRPGFCEAWNVFVQLGLTDDTFYVEDVENMSWHDYINSFLPNDNSKTIEEKLKLYLNISDDIILKLKWLGIFKNDKIGLNKVTPAQILQHILEKKWSLDENDKDMIVMQHQFIYEIDGQVKHLHSSLILEGENQTHTAMSMTVGLPVAIATKLILQGKIKTKGVQIPNTKEIYNPVLKELESYKIKFIDKFF